MKYYEEQELLKSIKTLGINLSRIHTLLKHKQDEKLLSYWIKSKCVEYEIVLQPIDPEVVKPIPEDTVKDVRQYIGLTGDIPFNVYFGNICVAKILKMENVKEEGHARKMIITLGVK